MRSRNVATPGLVCIMIDDNKLSCLLIYRGHGLSDEEIKDLWVQANVDGNGVLDYKKFLVMYLTLTLN